MTENGSFRDRLNTGRCGGERCSLNPGEQRRRSVKFTQKTPVRTPVAIPYERIHKQTRKTIKQEISLLYGNAKARTQAENMSAREECTGRCDVTNTDRSPRTLPRAQKPLRIFTLKETLCNKLTWRFCTQLLPKNDITMPRGPPRARP